MTTIRVIDTETTGAPAKGEVNTHRIMEGAYTDLKLVGEKWEIGEQRSQLFDPKRPCTLEALAVHHITRDMTEDCPSYEEATEFFHQGNPDYFAAHNLFFDEQFFDRKDVPSICTYKASLYIYEDSPKHSNQVLRYYLNIELPPDKTEPTHRALPDTYVTAHILMRMLDVYAPERLVVCTQLPQRYLKFGFGKHFGKKLDDPTVDTGYLSWVSKQSDMDDYIRTACQNEIKRRVG